ncbi:MAG: hypothetical protein JJ891_06645 [Rhizobiaceae bacterium]|nr:hypothetical protein [Rhizobiaceae bacterium]
MAELVYIDEQKAQAGQVLRSAVASGEFTKEQVSAISPEGTLEDTIQHIIESHCKVLITDYRLSDHKPDVEFNGADLVKAFRDRFADFPCFVTTSFPDQAVDETLDTNMVFPKSDFLDREEAKNSDLPFFKRVRKKIAEHERQVADARAELQKLSEQALERDLDASETQRFLDLDSYLEAVLGSQFAIERHVKLRALEPFDRLIGQTEELIDKIKNELGEPEPSGDS